MWLSQQFRPVGVAALSGFGEVTVPRRDAAAMAGGQEQRLLPVLSPGGYAWTPAAGDQVFILREGMPCILGVQSQAETLAPGEVLLYAGSASIRLCPNGEIRLTGQVSVNGSPLGGSTDGE